MFLNLIFLIIIFALLIFVFSDIDKLIAKYLDLHLHKNLYLLLIALLILPVMAVFLKAGFLLNFILSCVSVWASIYGFSVNRKYIYLLALILIVATSVFLIIGMGSLAELLTIYVYLLLVLGLLRDVFYEKIFKK